MHNLYHSQHQYLFPPSNPTQFQSYNNFNNNNNVNSKNENDSDSESSQSSYSHSKREALKINNKNTNSDYLLQQPPPDTASVEAAKMNAMRSKRRTRTKFTKHQLDILEATFNKTHYPDVTVVDRLSNLLNLATERISIWFQNRRARYKKTKKQDPSNLNGEEDEDEANNESDSRMSRCSSHTSISSSMVGGHLPIVNHAISVHQTPHLSNTQPMILMQQQEQQEQLGNNFSHGIRQYDNNQKDSDKEEEDEQQQQQQLQQNINQYEVQNSVKSYESNNEETENNDDKNDSSTNNSSNHSNNNNSSSECQSLMLKDDLEKRLEVETQFSSSGIPKSSSTIGFANNDHYGENLNPNGLLTPNSTSSSSRSSSTSTATTFMPNYYHQNSNNLLNPINNGTSAINSSFTNFFGQANLPYHLPFQPYHMTYGQPQASAATASYYPAPTTSSSQGCYSTPNLIYPQPPSSIYPTDGITPSTSFQNIFQQFQQQAAYMSSCYNNNQLTE